MAHYQQLKFFEVVSKHLPDFFQNRAVLEVGSWIANETVRSFFHQCRYVGADVAQGPGVDIVCPGQELKFADEEFDVVVSAECFEHNPAWQATLRNMVRMLKPGGLCVITCATLGRRQHATHRRAKGSSLTTEAGHDDYYCNLAKADFERALSLSEVFSDYRMFYNPFMYDIYFVGIKRGSVPAGQVFSDEMLSQITAITEARPPSVSRALRKRLKFWLIFAYAKLLGESSYHNINHWVRSGFRRSA